MMPGNDTTHQHHNGGGFDLLRRATQAMMSKQTNGERRRNENRRKGQPGLHGWPLSPAANRPLAALSGIAANGYKVAPPQRRALLWAEEGRGKEERGRVREQRRSQEAKRLSTILPHPPHSTPTRLPAVYVDFCESA
ncbi:hypothetical protein BBAD15_g2487 [Beauveria bassiana D1-5]|uniref:Uncharacterized protein n=1 Tax=Beauveria bassiana D1-5 TaxID=1245745 RepID=A0A0A2WF64_BEABA|nr:hypothetical protein BBAD15_g2487 [Beauveria bassiana D1-5]